MSRTNVKGLAEQRSGSLAVLMRGGLVALVLGYAAQAAYVHLGIWQTPTARALLPADTPPDKIEALLKAIPTDEREALVARETMAMQADPMERSALKNLIALWSTGGNPEKSEAMALVVAKLSLRDVALQAGAIGILLQKRAYAEALYRMDALVRAKPARAEELFQAMISLAEVPEPAGALADLLVTNPPWRGQFLASLSAKAAHTDTAYGLLVLLRKRGSVISKAELRPLLQRLITEKSYDKASFVWLDFLADYELLKATPVYDGGFDLDIGNRYFDWTESKLANVDLRIVPRATGSADRVLRVEFAPGRTPFNHFGQILRLSPGSYEFSGEGKAESLENAGGMVWRITCINEQQTMLLQSTPLSGNMAWAGFGGAFTVPATDCASQQLRLNLNAVAELDQQVSGRVFYDGLTITRK